MHCAMLLTPHKDGLLPNRAAADSLEREMTQMTPKLQRRAFLKLVGATTLGLFVGRDPRLQTVFAAPVPGGTIDPVALPKFQLPLVIPPSMPVTGNLKLRGGKNADYYEIAVRQFRQQILPPAYPPTTVWGYGSVNHPNTFNYPAFTIEAQWRTPVRVKWINDLKDADGSYLPHLLPVDPTLHWANPPGGVTGRDRRPLFDETPGRYTGPVPLVTHVHGAAPVGDESDGYAEAWYLPDAANIPQGYAREGTWYDFFKNKAQTLQGVSWTPGSATFQYPNDQRAATIWYHDHSLGMTRLNVYAGPAGFFLLRGGPADIVLDGRTGLKAVLPGPSPRYGDNPRKRYYEIPLGIQDRSFNADGSLFYPDTRAFFDGIDGPFIPDSDVSPIWNPEFFGNTIVVNGRVWPFLNVEQKRYRFRLLNGCNARFLIVDFSAIPGASVWQIGNEGGFLAAPVDVTALGSRLLMGPAERADVIVDFTGVPVGSYTLGNVGPDEPFGGGDPDVDFTVADTGTTGQVMQFRVGPALSPDLTTPPQFLLLPAITPLPVAGITRPLALLESMSMDFEDAPAEALLGRFDTASGEPVVAYGAHPGDHWSDSVTENPIVGAIEDWEFYNLTADAHPMHIHDVQFEVVNRQALVTDQAGEIVLPAQLDTAALFAPEPWENGLKDTVISYPGQVTRVRAQFRTPGQYVWHCHIVEHEDNEMMRPFRVGPEQPGQPT
jgi:FtsP/CotA-like multicopper oxidase with cupredoxin domain